MKSICFYNQKNKCSKKLTREHVVSASVLKIAFGDPIRNISRAEVFGNKALKDHEVKIKDVCEICNNRFLSPYDLAGKELSLELEKNQDSFPLIINFNKFTLGWLIKTHLNYARVVKDKEWGQSYKIKQSIKNDLIKHKSVSSNRVLLLVQQWEEDESFWNADSGGNIPYLQYRNMRFKNQEIFLSNFRIRQLDTLLLLPSNKCYKNFSERTINVLDEIKEQWDYSFQKVDLDETIRLKKLTLNIFFQKKKYFLFVQKLVKKFSESTFSNQSKKNIT